MQYQKVSNDQLDRLSVEEFRNSKKNSIIIVLDHVRSMQNIGSIFRSADAFLIEEIHLCGITATPPHRDIAKTALGSTETVNWKYFNNTEDSLSSLKQSKYKIFAVEQTKNSISLEDFVWQKGDRIALVFGHEVNGVQQKIIHHCDGVVEIPQWGTKHSFNISVSVGIVLWHIIGKG